MVLRVNVPASGPPPMMDRELADPYPRCCLAVPSSSFPSPVACSACCGCFFPFPVLSLHLPPSASWVYLPNKLLFIFKPWLRVCCWGTQTKTLTRQTWTVNIISYQRLICAHGGRTTIPRFTKPCRSRMHSNWLINWGRIQRATGSPTPFPVSTV